MTWTEEKIQKLIECYHQGITATQAMLVIGEGITRNAIVGKWYRLGLHSPKTISAPKETSAPKPKRKPFVPKTAKLPEAPLVEPVLVVQPISKTNKHKQGEWPLTELEFYGMCKWPCADKEGTHLFCGAATTYKVPYCEDHCRIAGRKYI